MSALASLFLSPAGGDVQTEVTSTQAVLRGLTRRCPNCGRGHMFGRFLKVVDRCGVCGEELFHHRADDFPAYLVIVLVGHAPALWLQTAIWLPLTAWLSIALLQPVKGAVVAMQWLGGMHGFAGSRRRRRDPALKHARASAPDPHSRRG